MCQRRDPAVFYYDDNTSDFGIPSGVLSSVYFQFLERRLTVHGVRRNLTLTEPAIQCKDTRRETILSFPVKTQIFPSERYNFYFNTFQCFIILLNISTCKEPLSTLMKISLSKVWYTEYEIEKILSTFNKWFQYPILDTRNCPVFFIRKGIWFHLPNC